MFDITSCIKCMHRICIFQTSLFVKDLCFSTSLKQIMFVCLFVLKMPKHTNLIHSLCVFKTLWSHFFKHWFLCESPGQPPGPGSIAWDPRTLRADALHRHVVGGRHDGGLWQGTRQNNKTKRNSHNSLCLIIMICFSSDIYSFEFYFQSPNWMIFSTATQTADWGR